MTSERAISFVLLGFVAVMVAVALLIGLAQNQWTIALPLLATAAALSVVALASLKKTNG